MAEALIPLRCGIKNDSWGKKGDSGLAARIWEKTDGNGPINPKKRYSEMWMGTYPSNPSYVLSSGEPLADYLKKNPDALGSSAQSKWGTEIPFLPKILSFTRALSLQIHPDKSLAERLHNSNPSTFSDPNHKPEIAIALTPFELFVGFKPLQDIQTLFQLPPLRHYVHDPTAVFTNTTLHKTCKALLSASPNQISSTLSGLANLPPSSFGQYTCIPELLTRLSTQYPHSDPGVLVAPLLMNYMTLSPGQAISIPPDSIHAYLSGDIVECMARSDNVLNTGFCPCADRSDPSLFVSSLTFTPRTEEQVLLDPIKSPKGVNGKTEEYAPPFNEFNVLSTRLAAWEKEAHTAIDGPSLMVVLEGKGRVEAEGKVVEVKEGDVFFVRCGVGLEFETDIGMLVYRAYAE